MMMILIVSSNSTERGFMRVVRWTMAHLTKALNTIKMHQLDNKKSQKTIPRTLWLVVAFKPALPGRKPASAPSTPLTRIKVGPLKVTS